MTIPTEADGAHSLGGAGRGEQYTVKAATTDEGQTPDVRVTTLVGDQPADPTECPCASSTG